MRKISSLLSLALSLLFFSAAPLFAHDDEFGGHPTAHGDLVIFSPWTRATPPNAGAGGAYLTITNTGSESDTLLGGSADFAERVEIHEMSMIDDVMRMRPVDGGLEIPAGETVQLLPGGYHVMMIGLTEPLKEGMWPTMTLTFEKAGDVALEFKTAPIGAKSPDGDHDGHGTDHGSDHSGHDHSGHDH